MKKLNVVVLMGGPSMEHEVSLNTGQVVLSGLDREKYNVAPVTVTKKGKWLLPNSFELAAEAADTVEFDSGQALDWIKSQDVDVVLVAMHGTYGEDGTIQALLESVGVPYTGSGVLASALAMDKVKSAELYAFHGLKVPRFVHITRDIWNSRELRVMDTVNNLGLPVFVKPVNLGSSVGISKLKDMADLEEAVGLAFSHAGDAMAQEAIDGTEVTCAVLDDGRELVALPPTEIMPKAGEFFTYDAKYSVGGSDEITPARLPAEMIDKIQRTALRAHKILGCAGMSRTDMIVKGDQVYVLETNTIPGMTQTSLLPQAAAAAGISFSELLNRLIGAALNRKK